MDMNERIRRAAGKIPPEEAPAPPPRRSGEGSADGGAASPLEPESPNDWLRRVLGRPKARNGEPWTG